MTDQLPMYSENQKEDIRVILPEEVINREYLVDNRNRRSSFTLLKFILLVLLVFFIAFLTVGIIVVPVSELKRISDDTNYWNNYKQEYSAICQLQSWNNSSPTNYNLNYTVYTNTIQTIIFQENNLNYLVPDLHVNQTCYLNNGTLEFSLPNINGFLVENQVVTLLLGFWFAFGIISLAVVSAILIPLCVS